MKKTLSVLLAGLLFVANAVSAQESYSNLTSENAEVSINFIDKTIYYPGNAEENPIYIHVTIANKGPETLRFKLADDRMFSADFVGFNVKNRQLPQTDGIIRKRTTNQTVYFREVSLHAGEEISFTENLKDFLSIKDSSIYYIELKFYPELYKNKSYSLVSNCLSLEVKPSPTASASNTLPVQNKTAALLQPEAISPDKVVEQTIVARQRSLWDQFFLYMDLEEMLKNDPVRSRKYKAVSADERNEMLRAFRADLMSSKIDSDIVSIPNKFEIEQTTYSSTDGKVVVKEWFKYSTYMEIKRYTYFVRQRDGIWMIYNYVVDNLGTN